MKAGYLKASVASLQSEFINFTGFINYKGYLKAAAFKSATAKGGKVVVDFGAIDQGLETADGKAPT